MSEFEPDNLSGVVLEVSSLVVPISDDLGFDSDMQVLDLDAFILLV